MLAPDEVAAMVRLHGLGWGSKRIAGELGCSRNTVKRYLAAGGWCVSTRAQRGAPKRDVGTYSIRSDRESWRESDGCE